MMIPFGILSAAGVSDEAGTYELIETITLGSSQASIVFSNLDTYSSTYKHLQIRGVSRSNFASNYEIVGMRLNGDTAGNYSLHNLLGNGSTVTSNATANADVVLATIGAGNTNTADLFAPIVIDILDAYSTTKNKTVRAFAGLPDTNREIRLSSGAWRNTNSITSASIVPLAGTAWLTATRLSIYGIRG